MVPHREKKVKKCSLTVVLSPSGTKPIKMQGKQHVIQCHYRFDILHPLDSVISHEIRTDTQNTLSGTSKSITVAKNTVTHRGHAVVSNMSDCDAITVANARNCQVEAKYHDTTKYDLPLFMKNKTAKYKEILPTSPTLKLWDVQNKNKFGITPWGNSTYLK